jgi:hypothetical protein
VDELIEVQWRAEDEYGNEIESLGEIGLEHPAGGQLVGVSRFRIGLPGAYTIGVTASDGVGSVRTTLEI